MRLAREITAIYHGSKKAAAAEAIFIKTFQKKEMPDKIAIASVYSLAIMDVLLETSLAASKGEARRLLEQGGIKVDGEMIKDQNFVISAGAVIQKGKREFRKIIKK